MQVDPVGAGGGSPAPNSTRGTEATDAFGLSFESLLRIVLTQLTYQDPLKSMDNFEFVSQLAQFSQIQQTQTMSDRLAEIASAQSTMRAAALLGRTVEIPAGAATVSGKVTAILLESGVPSISITTADGRVIAGVSLAAISRIREGD